MAQHDVRFSIPERMLGKNDVQFNVKRDGKPWGRLLVSKGGLEWKAANKQKGTRRSWRQVLDFFENPSSAKRRRNLAEQQWDSNGEQKPPLIQ